MNIGYILNLNKNLNIFQTLVSYKPFLNNKIKLDTSNENVKKETMHLKNFKYTLKN